jgi:putative redox protein
MPSRQRITFQNAEGHALAAIIEQPDRNPRAYALFAHCFTCGKDNSAASRIARRLAGAGIAVLRFDFTGLGGSDGDFANTNFSSNVEDLLAAADYLRKEHEAPALLVGHSLGGAAVIAAAARLPEVTAIATIAAPSSPEHVIKQFAVATNQIETEGEAEVSLGGRSFRIRREFLDDLRDHAAAERVTSLKRALLVMHAPMDATVAIDEASALFVAAKHPKSFVSLDGADHLLSNIADAQYAADTIAAWASRYLPAVEETQRPKVAGGEVVVTEGNQRFLREITSDDHAWLGDEPKRVGGDNLGPDPYEHLLAALGTCTSMTMRMYAIRKSWPLDHVSIRLTHSRKYADDCAECEESERRIEVIKRAIDIEGDLTDAQRQRLLEIADRCPVHRTLEGTLAIRTEEI